MNKEFKNIYYPTPARSGGTGRFGIMKVKVWTQCPVCRGTGLADINNVQCIVCEKVYDLFKEKDK